MAKIQIKIEKHTHLEDFSDNPAENVAKSLFILSSISLFGDMMSRKYLMMHISKYTFKGSVGKVIQGRDILIGMVARIENTLFHTRA